MAVPSFYQLINPVLKALHQLGGSASTSEIEDSVIDILKLKEKDINELHRGNTTKLSYRLAWARNYLKRYGLLENSARGVWALTLRGKETSSVNEKTIDKELHEMASSVSTEKQEFNADKTPQKLEQLWQEKLMEKIRTLSSGSFERLCQRILRESGFIKVEVTGKTGDEGIDGVGIVRLNGLLSFHVIFQCKRYVGSVSSSQVRDFRGAMQGRAEKGLLITTGTFTRDARAEATRAGAPHIDLVDGDDLVEKMKELGLGIIVKSEEIVNVDEGWFSQF